jgi:hypothetical protein
MSSDPIVSIFFEGELSKVVHGTIGPYDLHTPTPALKHSQ